MRDTWGDGWNNSEFTISELGISFAAKYPANPTTETVEFTIDTAGTYTINVSEGNYPAEVSWVLRLGVRGSSYL